MLGALHNGILSSWTLPSSSGTWKIKSGSYIGNGTSLSVSDFSFRPQFLIIKATGSTANDDPVMAWSGMSTSASANTAATVIDPSTAPATGIVTGYDISGFTVGSSLLVNTSGQQYYYFAMAGGTGETATGTYVGNGTDDRDISGLAFQPKLVFIRRRNLTSASCVRHEGMTGDFSYQFGTAANGLANAIQAFNSDGFQVGTNGMVNAATAVYDYIALAPPTAYSYFSAYTGTGVDNADVVTGVGFTPEMVLILPNTNQNPTIRGTVHTGDTSTKITNSVANSANRIQQFNSDGFQVGNAADVNSATTTYHFAMLKSS